MAPRTVSRAGTSAAGTSAAVAGTSSAADTREMQLGGSILASAAVLAKGASDYAQDPTDADQAKFRASYGMLLLFLTTFRC